MSKTTVIRMNLFIDHLSSILMLSCLNSFLVLIDNLIKTEGKDIDIENINIKEELYLSSIFLSTIFFIIDNIFLILIRKEKIIIEIVILAILILFIYKFKKTRKYLF
jgi:hypothetical protein